MAEIGSTRLTGPLGTAPSKFALEAPAPQILARSTLEPASLDDARRTLDRIFNAPSAQRPAGANLPGPGWANALKGFAAALAHFMQSGGELVLAKLAGRIDASVTQRDLQDASRAMAGLPGSAAPRPDWNAQQLSLYIKGAAALARLNDRSPNPNFVAAAMTELAARVERGPVQTVAAGSEKPPARSGLWPVPPKPAAAQPRGLAPSNPQPEPGRSGLFSPDYQPPSTPPLPPLRIGERAASPRAAAPVHVPSSVGSRALDESYAQAREGKLPKWEALGRDLSRLSGELALIPPSQETNAAHGLTAELSRLIPRAYNLAQSIEASEKGRRPDVFVNSAVLSLPDAKRELATLTEKTGAALAKLRSEIDTLKAGRDGGTPEEIAEKAFKEIERRLRNPAENGANAAAEVLADLKEKGLHEAAILLEGRLSKLGFVGPTQGRPSSAPARGAQDIRPAGPDASRDEVAEMLARIRALTPEQAGALSRTLRDQLERSLADAQARFPDLAAEIRFAQGTVTLPGLNIETNRTTAEMVEQELSQLPPGQTALIVTSGSNRRQYLQAFENDPRVVMVNVSSPTGEEMARFETLIRDGTIALDRVGRVLGIGAGTVQDIARQVTALVNEGRGTFRPGDPGRVPLSIYNTLPGTTAQGTHYTVTHGVTRNPTTGQDVDPANRVFISRPPDVVRVSVPDLMALPERLRLDTLSAAYGDVLAAVSKTADENIIEAQETGRLPNLQERLQRNVPHLLDLMRSARDGEFTNWPPEAIPRLIRALNQYPADSRNGLQVGGEHKFYDALERVAADRGVRAPPHGTLVAVGTLLQLRAYETMTGDGSVFETYAAAATRAGLPTTRAQLQELGVTQDMMVEALRIMQTETTQYGGRPTNTLQTYLRRFGNLDDAQARELIDRTFP